MYLQLILTLSCLSQVFSVPVTTQSNTTQCTAPCEWTPWFNVDHPQDHIDGGDFETLVKIRAHGYYICRAPRDIQCRSVRFPYVPFSQLQYKAQCNPNVGLICLNKDNEAKCVDFEVQLLCCPCDQVNDAPERTSTTTPSVSTVSTPSACTPSCQWTQWFNVDHPIDQADDGDWETLDNIRAHGYDICQAPKSINCRSVRFPYIPYAELWYKAQCDPSLGLICVNKDNVDTCIDFEVQLQCCTCEEAPPKTTVIAPVTIQTPATQCENPSCSWTLWFNSHKPTPGPDGGDFENITALRRQGYSVCDFPQVIQCRLERFPYVPLKELYSVQECSVSHGLTCLNKKQQDETCLDYEVQFLCCVCDVSTNPTTLVPSYHLVHETPTITEVTPTITGISEDNQGSGML